ncbi:hypothetical protein [Krasilnikovia sp. M28-CT-15]|uniref:hypothetical protein n=1 Tax=Krasilnikovia sp. M28-CT-15 TaxID=3373540 RepID=UPI00387769B9
MTDWAERVAHDMVATRNRRDLDRRPAWATEESDEFPPLVPATGRARINDAGLVVRPGWEGQS